jgi:selenide,water dikinase
MWLFPAGTGRNKDGFGERVRFGRGIAEELQQLLYTPETSGGLLAAVPSDRLDAVREAFASAGEPLWGIGEVRPGSGVHVTA